MPPTTYENIKHIFSSKDCNLLTTKEEFIELRKEKKPSYICFKFISSCGHENTVKLTNLISKNSGVICKSCMNIQRASKNSQNAKNTNYLQREIDFTRKFQEFIKDNFESMITNEGCKSDLIIKPKNIEEDQWLRIQIKVTEDVCNELYSFTIGNNDYENHIILCHCINQQKYWLIPHDAIKHIKGKKLNIGLTEKSAYYKFNINIENVCNELLEYYKGKTFNDKKIELFANEKSIISNNEYCVREKEYRKKIYDNLSFLNIEEPEYTNMAHDLIINGKKIQEKIIKKKEKGNGYYAQLFRTARTEIKKKNYSIGDNDFYWLHVLDTDYFFVIPEYELYKRQIITIADNIGKFGLYLHTDYNEEYTHNWTYEYLFDYKNINEEKLLKLLNDDYTDIIDKLINLELA